MTESPLPVKVLIVEDERLIAENSAIILRSLGYEVSAICSSVRSATEEINKQRPDIVLIDILLQGEMDGISFAKTLRSDYDIPFVYVTATADDSVLEQAKMTSPYGYVVKPFNERDLHSNIEMALYKFKTENKIEHINELLYALNAINRLGDHVESKDQYLHDLTKSLAASPSLQYVWAGLVDIKQNLISMSRHSKIKTATEANPLDSKGELAACVRRALVEESPVIAESPSSDCLDCGLATAFPGRPFVNVRISYEQDIYGVLSAIVLPSMAQDPEFMRLFEEVGHKAGVVMHSLASKEAVGLAQKALAMVEERFKRFTELAQDLILVYNNQGNIMYINPSGQELLGYELEDILGSNLEQYVAPRSIPELDERRRERKRSQDDGGPFEIYLRSGSGEEIPIEASSNPILEEDAPSSYLLICRDMRERKRQEAELEKLSSVVDQSPSAIVITDSNGQITYVNPRFTTMTGFTKEEVIGQFPAILKTETITSDIATDLIQTTTQGDVWRGELETLRSNGEKFWIYATLSSLRDEHGRNNYIGILEDITDKRQAALALKRSKQSYEDIFNSSSDGIYLMDENGVFLDVNSTAIDMHQQSREFLIGKSPDDVSAEGKNDLAALRQALKRAFTGKPEMFEFWGQRRDGSIFPTEMNINRVSYFGEKILMATARDISLRKRTEAELKAAAEKAEESEKVKGYFLANMSHEIRTPLTSIVGYIDLIFNRIKEHLSDKDREFFEIIRRNSDRLTRAVHSIIDLSQIEAGATKLEQGSININRLVQNVYNDHRMAAEGKSLKFTYHEPDQAFWMLGDKGLLQTAVSNLVDNAINYTEEGQVDLYLRPVSDGTCELEIKDTGIGIAKHSIQTIFESFSQESMGYTKDYQGLGLGLTLAKKNFELHHIQIDVESEKGQGSSFTVRFPELVADPKDDGAQDHQAPDLALQAEAPLQSKSSEENAEKATASNRILIVEDDENAQRLFGLFLKNDYDVVFATTVHDAREVMAAHDLSLVVTDLSLVGGENGLDLVQWIRTQDEYQDLPVIALTAHAFVSDRQKCLDAGCNDFITKPIFRAQLLEIIAKNLKE